MPVRLLVSSCLASLALTFSACDTGGSAVTKAECAKPSCSEMTRQNNGCSDGAEIQLGKYRVLNNLWGMNHSGVHGSQCTWSTCNTASGISWGTEYDWSGGPVGEVTSYSAAILGWHFSTIPAESGLPLLLSEQRPIDCSWSFELKPTTASTQNVAYDIWLSREAAPTGATVPTDEVMIWLHRSGGASPIGGSPVEVLSLPSGNFALSEGRNGAPGKEFEEGVTGWNVHSFVLSATAPCTDLNLTDFFDFLVERRGLDASKYVIGIEAGTEVFSGGGNLITNHFSCNL